MKMNRGCKGGSKMKDFDKIWTIYEEAFPSIERRDRESQNRLMKNTNYQIKVYYENDNLIGFIFYWDLQDFLFIEHLAVDKVYRGRGYGKKMMKEMLSLSNRNIILEVEFPKDELSQSRIEFYSSLGFSLNRTKYFQPSYGKDKGEIPLLLMSYPNLIPSDEEKNIVNKIHNSVYNFKGL